MPGPITKDTSSLALGLAQIRVGASVINIASKGAVLVANDSIGSLASTKFMGEIDYWKHFSGFPQLEDKVVPLKASAKLECSFEELSPKNLDLSSGIDVTIGSYTDTHSGEVTLGSLTSPAYLRMEAIYTFPDGTKTMNIIFPRAQVESSPEIDLQKEDGVAVPIVFASKRADSGVSGGHASWDDAPLGRITFKS